MNVVHTHLVRVQVTYGDEQETVITIHSIDPIDFKDPRELRIMGTDELWGRTNYGDGRIMGTDELWGRTNYGDSSLNSN